MGVWARLLRDQLRISVSSTGPTGTVKVGGWLTLRLRTDAPLLEQQEWKDAERTDASGVPTEGVRSRLRLRTSVASTGPLAIVKDRQERTDLSMEQVECADGVLSPTERLRWRSPVSSSGPRGAVSEHEERTDFSGVPTECAEGVRMPTEWLRLRLAVARHGSFGTVKPRSDK